MTLEEMCLSAARYSDRYDEFEKTEDDDGNFAYLDDAAHYLNVFRDAINEAYFAVSRERLSPDMYKTVTVKDGLIDLEGLDPLPYSVASVLTEDRGKTIPFTFETKFVLRVTGAYDRVCVYYHYLPDRLESLGDEPIFPESAVDPMVYISLAVARIWLSEKKIDLYQQWMSEYYAALRGVKHNLRPGSLKRVPRSRFILR